MQHNVGTGNKKEQQPKANKERQERSMESAKGQVGKSRAKQLCYEDIMANVEYHWRQQMRTEKAQCS
jgi:hypothetical protein